MDTNEEEKAKGKTVRAKSLIASVSFLQTRKGEGHRYELLCKAVRSAGYHLADRLSRYGLSPGGRSWARAL